MTETTRRTLLLAGASAVALAPLASVGTAFAAPAAGLYTRTRFTPLVSQAFMLVGATERWGLRLTKVSDLPQEAGDDEYCFSLTFRRAVAGPPQGTYSLRRSGFTATTLFVVPSDAGRRTYCAVINRPS